MKFVICSLLVICTTVLVSAQSSISCADDSLYQLMDFWVGDWQVYDQNDTLIGLNTIEKILNGCSVSESWTSIQGNKGKSLFYMDNNTNNWKQVWVTEMATHPGGQKEKMLLLARQDSMLLFQDEYDYQVTKMLDRTILITMDENEVEQTIQISCEKTAGIADFSLG